jgi:hypothetical protein
MSSLFHRHLSSSIANTLQTMPPKTQSKTPMEELVGNSLLRKVASKKPTKELLKDADLVLLYFSAAWCPVSNSCVMACIE